MAGRLGAIWFTVSNGIARMTTAGQGSLAWGGINYPYAITTGPDGNLWFTGFYQDEVGRFDPTTGKARLFRVATGCSPEAIAAAGGALWMGCYEENVMYRVSTTGSITAISVPPPTQFQGDVTWVAAGRAGAVWFTELSTDRLGRISGS